ncbi:MAG: chromate transporter, partial [Pseudomonadota bacterium]
LAGLAFLGIFFLAVPFPILIALAGIYGWWRIRPKLVEEPAPTATANPPTPGATLCTVVIWLAVWWLPVAGLWLMAPELLTEIALFFSKLAVVTFGGAYAVLAYMAQDVVTLKGWLSPGQMMDALGLAETTPGPLILVTQFVGFVAGFGAGGWASGAFAAAVTLWVTFVPCFLWIFASAPYIDRLATLPRLRGVLDAITAAVVGVILNLSVWFALHVFFADVARHDLGAFVLWAPDPATLDLRVVALCTGSAVLLWRGWSVAAILGTSAAVAALMHFIGV